MKQVCFFYLLWISRRSRSIDRVIGTRLVVAFSPAIYGQFVVWSSLSETKVTGFYQQVAGAIEWDTAGV